VDGSTETPTRRPPRARTVLLLVTAGLLAPIPMAPAQPGDMAPCVGAVRPEQVPRVPATPLRFGISPAGAADRIGRPEPTVPERPARTMRALERLRPSDAPFVVRLDRFLWSDGEAAMKHFMAQTRRYTRQGYPVELELRYHPQPKQEGNVHAFTDWVRTVIGRVAGNEGVVSVQVTNDVNLTLAPEAADGAYRGARDALIRGVVAAKNEARTRGSEHLQVGFSWFYRTDQANEQRFWEYIGERGGAAFASSVDWVGLEAFPGTYFPPAVRPGEERLAMVNALSALRECFLPMAGIEPTVPIHVSENGFPTGPGRSRARQAEILESMVRTVDEFHGTYNVTDYRWSNLRDADSASRDFQQRYGLVDSAYREKPSFGVFRTLVEELSIPLQVPQGSS